MTDKSDKLPSVSKTNDPAWKTKSEKIDKCLIIKTGKLMIYGKNAKNIKFLSWSYATMKMSSLTMRIRSFFSIKKFSALMMSSQEEMMKFKTGNKSNSGSTSSLKNRKNGSTRTDN